MKRLGPLHITGGATNIACVLTAWVLAGTALVLGGVWLLTRWK